MRLFPALLALAFAETALSAPKKVVVKKPEPAATRGQTSADERKNKVGTVALDFGFTLMPTAGIRGEYFATDDDTAVLVVSTGNVELGGFKASKTLIEARFKHFFGTSFYVDGGLGMELWDVTYGVLKDASTTFDETSLDGSVTNIGVEAHVGNQWQWDGFTLGCDWAGYFFQVTSSFEPGKADNLEENDKKVQEENVKELLGGSNPHLLRLYLGWSF